MPIHRDLMTFTQVRFATLTHYLQTRLNQQMHLHECEMGAKHVQNKNHCRKVMFLRAAPAGPAPSLIQMAICTFDSGIYI